MNYLFSGVSLKNKRRSNMDSLLIKNILISKKNALLAVVCDGVGSMENGAFASGTAVRMLGDWFDKVTNTERIGLKMRDAILEINIHILLESKRMDMDTASTLSALILIEDSYYIAHIGDSRIYSYADKTLTPLTNDDVSESGKLSACIGQSKSIALQYSEGVSKGKVFLLCSDGLYKRMDTDFITSKIETANRRTIKELVKVLTQYVIECGEQDNISIALVKIEN